MDRYKIVIQCMQQAGQYEAILLHKKTTFFLPYWVLIEKANSKISFDHLISSINNWKKQFAITGSQIEDKTIGAHNNTYSNYDF